MEFPRWIAGACVVLLSVVMCGPTGTSTPGPAPGTISGTITYDGTAAGDGRSLSIALYRTFPPKGPPVAAQLVERYQLPYHYSFDGLQPGTYYVGALIDVDPSDTRYAGMLNAARDPHAYLGGGQPVQLEELQGAAAADMRLEDPR